MGQNQVYLIEISKEVHISYGDSLVELTRNGQYTIIYSHEAAA